MEARQSDLMQDKVELYIANPSEDAQRAILLASEGLIYHFARFYGGGFCIEDLFQAGCEGVIKALRSYDPTRGVRFVTHASHGIMGEIRHYVRKERRYYYPAYLDNYQEKAYNYMENELENTEDLLSNDQIADRLNLAEKSMLPVMAAGLVHLNHIDLSQIKSKNYENFSLPVEDKLFITQLLYKLTEIQKDVIEMLFYKEMTQEEVARQLGITQKQVSRLKEKSLLKMRSGLNK